MLTLVIIGIALLAGYLLVAGAIIALLVNSWTGSLASLPHLSSQFWQDIEMWSLVEGMSMGIAILMAAAAADIGCSPAFATAPSRPFFPLDNSTASLATL